MCRITGVVVLSLLLAACGSEDDTVLEPAAHRPTAPPCATERGVQADFAERLQHTKDQGWGPIECESDAECDAQPDGRCYAESLGWVRCVYHDCTADADCDSGGVCNCGAGPMAQNVCSMGGCATDADCGANGYCSPSPDGCQPGFLTPVWQCHTRADECTDDADCSPENCVDGDGNSCQFPGFCDFDQDAARWRCRWSACVS